MPDYPAFFRRSRMRYFFLYSLSFALIIFAIWLYDSATQENAYIIAWVLALIGLALISSLEILIRYERITLTEHEIEHREGLLSKKVMRINYHSISNVNLNQTLIQRLFRFGDVYLDTPGGAGYEIVLKSFSDAAKIEQLIAAKTKHHQPHSKPE